MPFQDHCRSQGPHDRHPRAEQLACCTIVGSNIAQINNNLDELFALLKFLDNKKFSNTAELKKRYENLDATLIAEVQGMHRSLGIIVARA
jgi:hypothetical protein